MRKFYKAVFSIEILSEEPIDDLSLDEMVYAVTEGGCSGMVTRASDDVLAGPEMAKALLAQGSDAEFFQLDSDGTDLSEGDDDENQ
jgi:hypothetical protein